MAQNPQFPGQMPTPSSQPLQNQLYKRTVGVKPNKGDLVRFRYSFWKHDPYPLVLVTSQYTDGRVAGVNLHNLTLLDVKNLVSKYCNNKGISYQVAVKGRQEIVKGFRTYKWQGMQSINFLDCSGFLSRLGVVRQKKLLSPNEVAKLRQQIQQQFKRRINPRAQDMISQQSAPVATIPGKPASIPGVQVGGE